MPRLCLTLLVFSTLLIGCKNTEDYLNDLYAVQKESDGSLPLEIYDAGQLAHEAFSGLVQQETLTLSQLGRAIASAGNAVERNEVPLLRSEGLALLAHVALRYPVDPIVAKLQDGRGTNAVILEQTTALHAAVDRLAVGRVMIPLMESPDKADVERAYASLKKNTGKDFGRNPDAWNKWWSENRGSFENEVAKEAIEPLRILAGVRYPSLRLAHLVLTIVSYSLAISDIDALRADVEIATRRIGRQVIELAILKGLKDESPLVRAEAGLAAERVRAPVFGKVLAQSVDVESDGDAKVRMIRALRWYPGRNTVVSLMLTIGGDPRPSVQFNASQVLAEHTGRKFGGEYAAWVRWWNEDGGKTRWP